MLLYSAPDTAARIGVEGATLRKWCRKEWVGTLVGQFPRSWAFTAGDVALLSVTAALADFGIDAADAYAHAREALPDLTATSDTDEVIAYAAGKRMMVTRGKQVRVVERFPKIAGAMLLIDVGDVVRDALSRR